MSNPDSLITLGILVLVVIIANLAERRPSLQPIVFIALLLLNTFYVFYFGFVLNNPTITGQTLDFENAIFARLIAAIVGIAATLFLFVQVRRRLARLFASPQISNRGFDPNSPVHMTALVYCTYLLGYTFLNYVLAGGFNGLAQNFEGIRANDQILQMSLFIIFSVLGVGFSLRRSVGETLQRLGLQLPSPRDLFVGTGLAVLMIFVAFGVGMLWQLLVSPEILEEQTQLSGLLSQSINTIGLALLIASTAAIGEEIAFRGALQPIFGLGATTIFFALVHIQYTLTPATFIIIIVGFSLGWVRQRYNTTTAIVAHFLYNFGLMFLSLWLRYLVDTMKPS
ncbi:MAG: CPBP family intramembrane metalloprotease [Anaerolineae bacterium]|nr:CPBP family intramembrane metalloprotease [Anaerolineae bacterium]